MAEPRGIELKGPAARELLAAEELDFEMLKWAWSFLAGMRIHPLDGEGAIETAEKLLALGNYVKERIECCRKRAEKIAAYDLPRNFIERCDFSQDETADKALLEWALEFLGKIAIKPLDGPEAVRKAKLLFCFGDYLKTRIAESEKKPIPSSIRLPSLEAQQLQAAISGNWQPVAKELI